MKEVLALIGNPNVGKTAVFNELTGETGHVANWPGVTVEKKEGKMGDIQVIDLPGVYSLSPVAIDELIARNFILENKPKIVVDILDATNLERNLYLALLLKELEIPIIFVLNLMDVAKSRKIRIDISKLSEFLDSPVIPTVAIRGQGIEKVKKIIKEYLKTNNLNKKSTQILYSKELEEKISRTIKILESEVPDFLSEKRRWVAIKILEQDKEVISDLLANKNGSIVLDKVKQFIDGNEEFDFAGERYDKISNIMKQCYFKEKNVLTLSEILDKVFLNKYFGIPIFLIIMWAIFEMTFRISAPLISLIELGFSNLNTLITSTWPEDAWYTFFISDGIIGGFGAIIGFVPLIFTMFLLLSFLEDSGYFARAAFVMDRAMNKIGLHGKSFVSLILGFGCNIPAIMSCRTIENEKDRLTTILINQNISCGARLPVFVLLAAVVWPGTTGTIVFSLYLIGMGFAILMALFFRKVIFRGEKSPFILELGDYRMPTIKYTAIHMWERGREFIKKAGLIIFSVVVIMWLLLNLPPGTEPQNSFLALLGKSFQPLFAPLNWSWVAVVGIILGFLAKEVVIAAFGLLLLGTEEASGLGQLVVNTLPAVNISEAALPALVYGYLVFVLLYTPCIATIGAIYKETGSIKWTLFSAIYGIFLGYCMALLINLIGGVYF